MSTYKRGTLRGELHAGKMDLVRHRPDLAMMHFRKVVEYTTADRAKNLAEALYWLAVSLFRLDRAELAIRTLASAQRLLRRGHARELYLAWVNGYGMISRGKPELDDFYAYSSLQLGRYLARKAVKRFDTMDEKDMAMRVVMDSWKRLLASGALEGKSCSEKLILFRSRKPVFPSMHPGTGHSSARMLSGEFGMACPDTDSRCRCGSGLPHCMCCGRIPGLRELSGG
jgi:hypothetical protein